MEAATARQAVAAETARRREAAARARLTEAEGDAEGGGGEGEAEVAWAAASRGGKRRWWRREGEAESSVYERVS